MWPCTLWAIAGCSLAFGAGNAWFGDFSMTFLNDVGLEPNDTIPDMLFMGFQGTFAIITAALISGAVVERINFILTSYSLVSDEYSGVVGLGMTYLGRQPNC